MAAKSAGLPCWMIGNFGWNFIYGDWGEEFASISDWISRCYNQCDRLFKLPLAEAMTAFPHKANTRLPMGYAGPADIFKSEMMKLMEALDYVRAHIEDLLVITRGTL